VKSVVLSHADNIWCNSNSNSNNNSVYIMVETYFSVLWLRPALSICMTSVAIFNMHQCTWTRFYNTVLKETKMLDLYQTCQSTYIFFSCSRPTWRQACSPILISCNMSASFFCISWLAASGRSNWLRSRVYCRAIFIQNSAAPRAPHAIPYRALFRHPKGPYEGIVIEIMCFHECCK
jgi:hypothetical protein